jgi:hypothetical protein
MGEINTVLSLNRGLWLEVSPALRAAQIKWDHKTLILNFYYNGEISDEDWESAECVSTEVISEFPEYELEINIVRLDEPQPIPLNGILVYHRKETPKIRRHFYQASQTMSERARIMLAVISALQGEIFPSLRQVSMDWDSNKIDLYFYSDGDSEKLSLNDMKSLLINQFPEKRIEIHCIRWDYPQKLPQKAKEIVFCRRE